MGTVGLIFIAIGLSMDACAVAICKGLSMKRMDLKKAFIVGGYFGIFQAIMPFAGYLLGVGFQDKVEKIDHWIALILLGIIGINMIKEAFSNEEDSKNSNVDFKEMIILAIATSVDALAIGITFAFLDVNILTSVILIGVITFIISVIGVKIGNVFGTKYEKKAQIAGGIILIGMGIKILLEHLGILKF